MAKLAIDTNSYLSLESQLERLSLEANFLTNLSDLFNNIIPSLAVKLNDASNQFKSQLFDSSQIKNLKSVSYSLNKKIPHANFGNYESSLFSIPEGFVGNLQEYLIVLNNSYNNIFSDINSLLSEYNFILASFITNKEDKISLKDHDSLYVKAAKQREHYNKVINVFFDSSKDTSRTKLSSLISRFSDIDNLVKEASKLQIKRQDNNIMSLADSVKKSIDLLNIIKTQIDEKRLGDISGNASKNIANGAYEVAKYIEFVSIYRYRTEQAVTTVQNLLERLDTMLV